MNKTYVTLSDNEEVLSSITVENKEEKYHSAFLISTIVEILKKFNIQIKDIDVFGVNIGPGSFTGIRACITVARVFANQTDKPLVGVSSLEILSKLNNSEKDTLVLLDARRKQFYAALYSQDGKEILSPQLIEIENIDSLPLKTTSIICDEVCGNILSEKGIEATVFTDENADLGLLLNKLVNEKIKLEKDYCWVNTKPLYLQTPPISCKPVLKK